MVEQNFLSPQVKRSEIISNKLVYNKLPQELPYDVRLRKLGIDRKITKLGRIIAQCLVSPEMKI